MQKKFLTPIGVFKFFFEKKTSEDYKQMFLRLNPSPQEFEKINKNFIFAFIIGMVVVGVPLAVPLGYMWYTHFSNFLGEHGFLWFIGVCIKCLTTCLVFLLPGGLPMHFYIQKLSDGLWDAGRGKRYV